MNCLYFVYYRFLRAIEEHKENQVYAGEVVRDFVKVYLNEIYLHSGKKIQILHLIVHVNNILYYTNQGS